MSSRGRAGGDRRKRQQQHRQGRCRLSGALPIRRRRKLCNTRQAKERRLGRAAGLEGGSSMVETGGSSASPSSARALRPRRGPRHSKVKHPRDASGTHAGYRGAVRHAHHALRDSRPRACARERARRRPRPSHAIEGPGHATRPPARARRERVARNESKADEFLQMVPGSPRRRRERAARRRRAGRRAAALAMMGGAPGASLGARWKATSEQPKLIYGMQAGAPHAAAWHGLLHDAGARRGNACAGAPLARRRKRSRFGRPPPT